MQSTKKGYILINAFPYCKFINTFTTGMPTNFYTSPLFKSGSSSNKKNQDMS